MCVPLMTNTINKIFLVSCGAGPCLSFNSLEKAKQIIDEIFDTPSCSYPYNWSNFHDHY